MKKTAFLVDSTIVLSEDLRKREDIFVVPLSISFEAVSFKEIGDMMELTHEVTARIDKEKKIPKTSQPSVQDFIDVYEKIISGGYERIIGLHISSVLSGTIQGSQNAANIVKEEHPEIEIELYDTLLTSTPALFSLTDIIEEFDAGNELTSREIEEIVEHYRDSIEVLFLVDNLDYLSYGGRIKPAVAAIGNLFGVKPILQLKDGAIIEYDRVRSQKKAFELMIDKFRDKREGDETMRFAVVHMLAEKNAWKLLNVLNKISGEKRSEFDIIPLSPVIGNHTGPGTVGMMFAPGFRNKNVKNESEIEDDTPEKVEESDGNTSESK